MIIVKLKYAATFLICGLLPGLALAYTPTDGDIIFQSSASAQSAAVEKATHSPLSHIGIIFMREGQAFVLEAVGPVKYTPLAEWEAGGVGGHYSIRRLRQPLPAATMDKVRAAGEALLGRPYDFLFGWSDNTVYCSELVWKAYQRGAHIEVGHLQTLRDFDLSDPVIAALVRQRYGKKTPPLDAPVISPAAVFASEKMVTVEEH
jgi:hypothetical protein